MNEMIRMTKISEMCGRTRREPMLVNYNHIVAIEFAVYEKQGYENTISHVHLTNGAQYDIEESPDELLDRINKRIRVNEERTRLEDIIAVSKSLEKKDNEDVTRFTLKGTWL